MSSNSTVLLIREVLDYLDIERNPFPTWIRRKKRLALIERVRTFLESPEQQLHFHFPDVVEETREAWAPDARIRIKENAIISADRDGLWVAAKLLAGGLSAWTLPERLATVLSGLPSSRREVFRLYRNEHLDHAEIAARLDMDADAVRSELIAALAEIVAALHGREN